MHKSWRLTLKSNQTGTESIRKDLLKGGSFVTQLKGAYRRGFSVRRVEVLSKGKDIVLFLLAKLWCREIKEDNKTRKCSKYYRRKC